MSKIGWDGVLQWDRHDAMPTSRQTSLSAVRGLDGTWLRSVGEERPKRHEPQPRTGPRRVPKSSPLLPRSGAAEDSLGPPGQTLPPGLDLRRYDGPPPQSFLTRPRRVDEREKGPIAEDQRSITVLQA